MPYIKANQPYVFIIREIFYRKSEISYWIVRYYIFITLIFIIYSITFECPK